MALTPPIVTLLSDAILACHEHQVARGLAAGLQVTVRAGGEVVADLALGASVPYGEPLTADTGFPVFSCGKAVAATLVHLLVDRGALGYDDRVAAYVPGFGRHGKDAITVRQLLTHEAGIPDLAGRIPPEVYADPAEAIEAIGDLPLEWEPGTRAYYHAYTATMLVREVVTAVTGRAFDEVSRQELLEPIGMSRTAWTRPSSGATGLTTDHADNQPIIDVVVEGPLSRTVCPSGSMWSTARDLARFYQTWLDHGRPPGSRQPLWSPVVQQAALTPAHPMRAGGGRSYSAGFFVGHDPDNPWAFGAAAPTTFGHPGWTNATALCDPGEELVVVALHNRSLEQSASDHRLSELVDLIRGTVRTSMLV